MTPQTICEFEEESVPVSETEIELFESKNDLRLPEALRQILIETNGGYVREERLLFDDDDDEVITGVEEVFGISSDDVDWSSSIVPLERWVKFKRELYPSFPSVELLEELNGSISRYFVMSGDGVVFYLLDYTGSKECKRICYLDLVGGDQIIVSLGDDISCVVAV